MCRKGLLLCSFIFSILFCSSAIIAQTGDSLLTILNSLGNDFIVEETTAIDSGYQSFLLKIRQPIDHNSPEKGTFWQRFYLGHFSPTAPMVMVHQGYGMVNDRLSEPATLLKANQIRIEHRYFNESRPDSLEWEYLTIKQSAYDKHRIVSRLKSLYPENWLNTGISKGGQSALFFRHYFPDDVTATVAYVAPVNLKMEDPRLNTFLKTVGTEACRDKLDNLQKRLLQNRSQLIPMIEEWSVEHQDPFRLPAAAAFEYAVLEYTFSFWQYAGISCDSLPGPDASAQELFDNLVRVVGLTLFTESGGERFSPFYYQAYHEMGYYRFNTEHLHGLLIAAPEPDNSTFIPRTATKPQYNPQTMRDIHRWLKEQGNNIIYIYGETDAWSATAMVPGKNTNAIKMVKAGGDHGTRIASFSEDEQQMLLITLKEWLNNGRVSKSVWQRNFHLFNSLLMLTVVLIILAAARRKMRANRGSDQT